jgi:hypothetical protein
MSDKLKHFLFFMVCAFLVHKSVIVMLPFYYFLRIGLTTKTVFFIVLASILCALSIEVIVDVASTFDQRYLAYADSEYVGGGLMSVLFYSALLIWLYFSMKVNHITDKIYFHAVLALLVAVCIGWISYILSLNPSGILRLMIYFVQFSIFAIPISIKSFKSSRNRIIIAVSVYTVLFIYFYFTTSYFSGLTPYKSVLELHL